MLVFATLLAALSSTVRSRAALELENLALRHQIGVLQRSTRKRPKLTPVDRLECGPGCPTSGATRARRWRLFNPRPPGPGTAGAFVSSGHGRFGEAGREDPRLPTKFAT